MARICDARAQSLERLKTQDFDVVVIGGGITGAGALLEAASRGYRAALIEASDFASGTSSASSKLIHGGLRYLAQGEIRLVYQNLAERTQLLRNAPGLVSRIPLVIPIPRHRFGIGSMTRLSYSAALWGYDLTGGMRIGQLHSSLALSDVKSMFAHLDTSRFSSSFLYHDGWADDARLVLAVIELARSLGAVALNYVEAQAGVLSSSSKIKAIGASSKNCGDPTLFRAGFEISTKSVINATGVGAQKFLEEAGLCDSISIRPAKGVHIAFRNETLATRVGAVLPVPGEKRTIFVLPWGQHSYVGTTDTDLGSGALSTEVADLNYLLEALNSSLDTELTLNDISGAWVGARPLVDGHNPNSSLPIRTGDLSRRHRIITSKSGVIFVIGGKLTTFRRMAQDAIDALDSQMGRKTKSISASLAIQDPYLKMQRDFSGGGIATNQGAGLKNTWRISTSEINYMVEHLDALELSDILMRRTRVGILDRADAIDVSKDALAILAKTLRLTSHEQESTLEKFHRQLDQNFPPLLTDEPNIGE